MGRWLAVLGGLCLVALVRSAAVPTQDTLVVARSDDTVSTAATSVAEITTEESAPAIKLTEMEVKSEVALRYTHTTVVARMRNPAKYAQEASFRVILPETAFISGFVMTLDGKSYKAYVKEKEEAKKIYSDAIFQGLGAAHISAKARDSNHFIVSVNIEASSTAIFNLTYEEMLQRRNGVYNHAINLHPGSVVPKLTVTVHIKEAQKISELRVPEIRTGNEIDASKDDAQLTRANIVKSDDGREASITFTPDLQEQERLIQIYTQKSKESAAASHAHSYYDSDEPTTPEGVLGQFVVQYDVERPKDGEILVNDGYFVHFYAPPDLPPLNKFVVFVLDTSGSMMDRKIVQLRDAMQTILGDLNIGDYFSIVEFASAVTVHDLKEADREPPKAYYSYFDYDKKATLVPPSPVTPQNIARAKVIISRLQAVGGTNIGHALDVAVQLVNKGVDWKEDNITTITTTATIPPPQEVASEASASTTTVATTSTTTEAAVDKAEAKKPGKSLEPMIIFLTDGDPTVGETDPKRIMTLIQEKNSGENKATIFCLAFGEDADRKFLRKMALRNGGFMRHIYEASDAVLQLRDFYRQISSPVLSHLKFRYANNQVKQDSLTKHDFRTFYAGSEVVIAGRVEEEATEIAPLGHAFCGASVPYDWEQYEIRPKVPVVKKRTSYLPLERLWAYLTIKQLLDKNEQEDKQNPDLKSEHEREALRLALQYEFVTPLTSLVVVKPNATDAINAESVDKAAGPPGVSQGLSLSLSSNLLARPMASYSQSFAPPSYAQAPGAYGLPGRPAPGPGGFAALYSSRPSADFDQEDAAALEGSYEAEGMRSHYYSYSSAPGRSSFGVGAAPGWSVGHSSLGGHLSVDYHSSSSLLSTTPRPASTIKPGLSEYHLQNFRWAEELLAADEDALLLSHNDTVISLKLTKDSDVPKEGTDVACTDAVDGGANVGEGVCVYLTRCAAAENITADVYRHTYCTVQGFAGVCCKKDKVDQVHT